MSTRIDPATLIEIPLGTFNGVGYSRFEAMFEGTTAGGGSYRVPCQIIAPTAGQGSSGLLLFDWLNTVFVITAIGRDFGVGRYMLTDDFLFGRGTVCATVRSSRAGLGTPWMDGTLDAAGEFISDSNEAQIVVDFVQALESDPLAVERVGPVQRRAAFGFSRSGHAVRRFLRSDLGAGLFDFSLAGGAGADADDAPPPPAAGLCIEFNTENEIVATGPFSQGGSHARKEAPNLRVYEFAGCAHGGPVEAAQIGLVDPEKANPADWFPLVRALFVAADQWCDGVEPPPSIWLGQPHNQGVARDAKENAVVRFVGGEAIETDRYRLPEVAVGQNQYVAFDPAYRGPNVVTGPAEPAEPTAHRQALRAFFGGFVDLTDTFTSHEDYVTQITDHAETLRAQRYLLDEDAAEIIRRAEESSVGG